MGHIYRIVLLHFEDGSNGTSVVDLDVDDYELDGDEGGEIVVSISDEQLDDIYRSIQAYRKSKKRGK